MNKMIKKIDVKKYLLIILYLVSITIFILSGSFNFLSDKVSDYKEISLSLNDFSLHDLEVIDDTTLVSIGADAQMIFSQNQEIKSVYYKLKNNATGVVCSYYLENENQDFSNYNRLFPEFSVYDEAFYIYPDNTYVVRLDIGSVSGELYEFEEITLNKEIAFYKYFSLTNFQVVLFLITPAIVYSIIKSILLLKESYLKKENKY